MWLAEVVPAGSVGRAEGWRSGPPCGGARMAANRSSRPVPGATTGAGNGFRGGLDRPVTVIGWCRGAPIAAGNGRRVGAGRLGRRRRPGSVDPERRCRARLQSPTRPRPMARANRSPRSRGATARTSGPKAIAIRETPYGHTRSFERTVCSMVSSAFPNMLVQAGSGSGAPIPDVSPAGAGRRSTWAYRPPAACCRRLGATAFTPGWLCLPTSLVLAGPSTWSPVHRPFVSTAEGPEPHGEAPLWSKFSGLPPVGKGGSSSLVRSGPSCVQRCSRGPAAARAVAGAPMDAQRDPCSQVTVVLSPSSRLTGHDVGKQLAQPDGVSLGIPHVTGSGVAVIASSDAPESIQQVDHLQERHPRPEGRLTGPGWVTRRTMAFGQHGGHAPHVGEVAVWRPSPCTGMGWWRRAAETNAGTTAA